MNVVVIIKYLYKNKDKSILYSKRLAILARNWYEYIKKDEDAMIIL